MLKWLLTIAIVVIVLGMVMPGLQQNARLKRLPGDITVRWRGRDYYFPFTTTILLSLVFFVVSRLI